MAFACGSWNFSRREVGTSSNQKGPLRVLCDCLYRTHGSSTWCKCLQLPALTCPCVQTGIPSNENVYTASLYVAVANLPGNVWSAYSMDRFGRKWTLITTMMVSGLSLFVILGVSGSDGALRGSTHTTSA